MAGIGKILVIIGIVIIIVGLVIWLGGDRLSWFGKLPGDIRIERETFRFYFPVTSMIILSIFLSAAIWLIRKFM